MLAVNDLATRVGMRPACRAFAFNPGYVYRDRARQGCLHATPDCGAAAPAFGLLQVT